MQFAEVSAWLNSIQHDLETEDALRNASFMFRNQAQMKFTGFIGEAVRQFEQANNGQFPTDLSQLLPYCDPAVGRTMLEQYQIAPRSSVSDTKAAIPGDWLITRKTPVNPNSSDRLAVVKEGRRVWFENWIGRLKRFITIAAVAFIFVGCGGTYVDDKHNFERAFKCKQPDDIQVVHSIYYQSPHFTDEHCFYFELLPATNSNFLNQFTTAPDIVATNGSEIPTLGLERPKWFAPKSKGSYKMWVYTNQFAPFGILQDTQDHRLFFYGSDGM
jgi:hypothetical protein